MRSIEDQMNEIRRRKDIYNQAKKLRNKTIGACRGSTCQAIMRSSCSTEAL